MSDSRANELRIPLRHLILAAKAWGDPSDPPLLAVHGWLDNAGTFDRLAPLLPGHYLVALDLAGHGRSGHRPAASWYPYADFLDEIGQVIDWFGWASVDLLGHSLGAALVSTFAAICPDKVRRLLLVEGLGPLTQGAEKTLDQLRRSYAARASFDPGRLRVFSSLDEAIDARCRSGHLSVHAARCIVERGVKRVGGSDGQREQGANSGLEQFQASAGFSWSSDAQLTIPSPTRLTEEQLAAVLPAIVASTLIVLAEPHAPYLQTTMVDARIALLADIEVVRMAGTHHLHLENPEPVAVAMRDFLTRHPLVA
ncbi:MAG: alpha/beta fold hydrolase [Xanthomonadales bacterium]|nr:alpha/beta fold hydrolase [Xanthomonadales bacterium]